MGKIPLKDRIERYKTGAVNYMKAVAPEGEPCVMPGREAYERYMSNRPPNWRNQVTLESLEKMREFDPAGMIHMMSPTTLLIIVAEKDSFFPLDLVKAVYEKAGEPKAIAVLPIRHFEAYHEPWLSKAANMAIDWFRQHL